MKFRIPPRNLLTNTNHNRPPTSNTLHRRHYSSLLIRSPHMPKRTVRLTDPQPTCQRSILLLHLHLPTHRSRTILWLLPIQRNLKHRDYPTTHPHSNCLRRLRTPMRPNILLRSYSHHQPILSYPLHRTNHCRMSLRRILRRQPYPHPILRPTFPTPIPNRRPYLNPSYLPPRIRLKQPPRYHLKLR
uniref:Uncharacterized protein n=1 Tax=Buteo japonicus TaxID=224669 RepID=A0A8B9Z7Y4_9AVES